MENNKKTTGWTPLIRPDVKCLTYIPGLFNCPAEIYPPYNEKDPFICPEVLKETCSVTSEERVPKFAVNNADIDDTIDFCDEDWNEIIQSQLEWESRELEMEKRDKEIKELENQQKKEKEAADSHVKEKVDYKIDRIFNRHKHYIRKTCPVMIPYKSSLNHEEHKIYLRAFVKFRTRSPVTAAESLEYENYLRLQNRVYEEQQCFMSFAYQVARLQLKAYNEVPDVISNYVSDYVKEHCNQVLNYKRLYTQEQSIPICPLDPTNKYSDLYFNHVGHLLSIGYVPWIKLPNPHLLCQIPVDDSLIRKRKVEILPDEEGKFLNKVPVSKDPNAVYLAKKHAADVVVSASALKIITDNHGPNFDKEWDIPVVVRSYSITDSDGKEQLQRVVFIDKPMPKMIWSPTEKKQLFLKKSALASMTEIKGDVFFRARCPLQFRPVKGEPDPMDLSKDDFSRDEKYTAEYTEDFFDFYSSNDHDVFGVESPLVTSENEVKSTKKRKITSKGSLHKRAGNQGCNDIEPCSSNIIDVKSTNNKTVNDGHKVKYDKSDDKEIKLGSASVCQSEAKDVPSMLDDLLSMQDSLHKKRPLSESPIKQDLDDTTDAPKNRKLWPWSDSLKTDWEEHTEAKGCKSYSGANYHYQLFSMGFNNSKPYSSSQPIRIIVRHGLHGLTWYKSKKGQSKAYVLHAKPEFQAYFGCEVNTISEITQQWLDLLVRPNTRIVEVRACQTSGDIMLTDIKTFPMVLREGKQQHINFSPQQPLATMHALFTTLTALSTGDYILHHDGKTEAFIKLMKAIDENKDVSVQTFDFHAAYSAGSVYTRTHPKPPWIALDTHKLTAFHLKHYKIPGTFPMDNPSKKLSKREKKKIKEKAKQKKRLADIEATDPEKSD